MVLAKYKNSKFIILYLLGERDSLFATAWPSPFVYAFWQNQLMQIKVQSFH